MKNGTSTWFIIFWEFLVSAMLAVYLERTDSLKIPLYLYPWVYIWIILFINYGAPSALLTRPFLYHPENSRSRTAFCTRIHWCDIIWHVCLCWYRSVYLLWALWARKFYHLEKFYLEFFETHGSKEVVNIPNIVVYYGDALKSRHPCDAVCALCLTFVFNQIELNKLFDRNILLSLYPDGGFRGPHALWPGTFSHA